MANFSVELTYDIEKGLNEISRYFNRSKGYITREALKEYILQLKEDIEDYKDIERFEKNQSTSAKSLEEIKRDCGLLEN